MSQNDAILQQPASATSDETLVRLAQRGDPDAFTALYERYLTAVYKRVRYSIPERDAEDVTQEVFITAMRSLAGFKGDAKFSTWLRTLVKRRIADYYRRRSARDVEMDVDLSEADSTMPQSVAVSNTSLDDEIVLRRAIRELPEDYREVLLLRFADGLHFHEIAQARGQSLEAAKSLFRRAIEAMRKRMEDTYAR